MPGAHVSRVGTAHWDGQSWRAVPSVSGFTLHSATSFAGDDVWAVGQTQDESLAIHYADPCKVKQAGAPESR
jgi:hypothetical protein